MRTPDPAKGAQLVHGRRIFAFGASLGGLAHGPLAGADLGQVNLAELAALPIQARDLVIIDADAWEPAALAHAVQALAALPAPPAVLTVGASLPTTLVRSLLRLERSDVLEAPFTDEQMLGALAGLLDEAAPAQAAPAAGGQCWAVIGAVGGAGATTISIEIATALAARVGKEHGVCLIDLNLVDGAAAAYLGVSPTMRLAPFAHTADRLDASLLPALVTQVDKHLDLLAAPRDATGFDSAGREAVLRLLEAACELYAWVIIDLPRHRRDWTLEALAGCDEVLVISELTVPALIAARSLADEIDLALSSTLKPRIVLNRLPASKVFGGPAPNMSEAERALQRKADAGVSSDWEAAAASANLGGPISHHRPKSKIVSDIRDLVDRLAAGSARTSPNPPPESRLMNLLRSGSATRTPSKLAGAK